MDFLHLHFSSAKFNKTLPPASTVSTVPLSSRASPSVWYCFKHFDGYLADALWPMVTIGWFADLGPETCRVRKLQRMWTTHQAIYRSFGFWLLSSAASDHPFERPSLGDTDSCILAPENTKTKAFCKRSDFSPQSTMIKKIENVAKIEKSCSLLQSALF